jgi:hypothetical protein
MRDEAPDPYFAAINWCETLKQLVVTITDHQPPIFRIESPTRRGHALFAHVPGCDVHDFDSLLKALWLAHGDTISAGRFSYREKRWQPFNASELTKIEQVLGQNGA